jgi:prevent-host-death family protein
MTSRAIGVRELRQHLNEVLTRVETGETILVTNNGRMVARIEPARAAAPDEVLALLDAGGASWSGQPLEDFEPIVVEPGVSISDVLLAQRD